MATYINGRRLVDAPNDFTHTIKTRPFRGKAYEYIVVASQMLGRDILPSEVVHHIDGNPSNNSPENLMVFVSNRVHAIYHKLNDTAYLLKMPNGAYDINLDMYNEYRKRHHTGRFSNEVSTDGIVSEFTHSLDTRKPLSLEKKASYSCTKCGKAITGDGVLGLCIKCVGKAHRKTEHPTPEKLKELVWSMPTTHVATMFGVTDKAVDKWCELANIDKPPRGYWSKKRSEKMHQN